MPPVAHQGTYNAEPVSAAAGIATLKELRDTDAIERHAHAAAIRDRINEATGAARPAMVRLRPVFGFPFISRRRFAEDIHAGRVAWQGLKGNIPLEIVNKIRVGFLLHGVDIASWPGGLVSAAHNEEDVARTVKAFESAFAMLAEEGSL